MQTLFYVNQLKKRICKQLHDEFHVRHRLISQINKRNLSSQDLRESEKRKTRDFFCSKTCQNSKSNIILPIIFSTWSAILHCLSSKRRLLESESSVPCLKIRFLPCICALVSSLATPPSSAQLACCSLQAN